MFITLLISNILSYTKHVPTHTGRHIRRIDNAAEASNMKVYMKEDGYALDPQLVYLVRTAFASVAQ